MTSSDETTEPTELVSALSVVEQQPLADRAEGYAKIYEELRSQLEDGDASQRD